MTTTGTFNPWAGFHAAFGDTPPAGAPAPADPPDRVDSRPDPYGSGPAPDGMLGLPVNALTGEHYRGKNIARLLVAAAEHGYIGPEWAGFTQWRKVGRTVRKGEHGTACLTVVSVVDATTGRAGTRPRGFKVFHRDQTEALPEAGEVTT